MLLELQNMKCTCERLHDQIYLLSLRHLKFILSFTRSNFIWIFTIHCTSAFNFQFGDKADVTSGCFETQVSINSDFKIRPISN